VASESQNAADENATLAFEDPGEAGVEAAVVEPDEHEADAHEPDEDEPETAAEPYEQDGTAATLSEPPAGASEVADTGVPDEPADEVPPVAGAPLQEDVAEPSEPEDDDDAPPPAAL
jgi:hypothetical protein